METVVHGPLVPAIVITNTVTVSIESNLAPNDVYTALVITVNSFINDVSQHSDVGDVLAC